LERRAAEQETASPGRGLVFRGISGEGPSGPAADHLADFYRLGDPALSDLDLDELLDELLLRVRQILDVDTVAILLIDDERKFLHARAAKGLEEEVERGVRIPVGQGFAGRIAAERLPIYIADVDHADILNPILREKGVRSLLGVPLIVEGEAIGVMHVGTLTPRDFTNDDAALLQLAAARAAPSIERARLFQALEQEHSVAIGLQRSLLPERLPEITDVTIGARYLPSRDEVGGDWYDVIELDRGCVGIAIGDVVGHGVRAAALMGQLRTGLRAYALDGRRPGEVLARADYLLQTIRGRGMATAAYGVFDLHTNELRIANAGHPPPLIVPASGEPRFLEIDPAPPLGTVPNPEFPEITVQLAPEETVLLYTDGLIEVRGESLHEGLERLAREARGALSADGLCQQVIHALVPRGGAEDDVAVVALQNAPIPTEIAMRLPADPTVLTQVRRVLRRWLQQFDVEREDAAAITLACGEACANAIEHAYSPATAVFELDARLEDGVVTIAVRDSGQWRIPRGRHRGRGLRIIESSMDEIDVHPSPTGTEVVMRRRLKGPRTTG
jgi:anti-sigma regulatory factor (Ser/Thr protein kinase)/putative methionine-R-sulfoxide reductase with GAF domain